MTNARQLPANGHTARQRLTATGISERAISARTGLGMSYLRSLLNHNTLNSSATLSDLDKFRRTLGLTCGDLLDTTPPTPTANEDDVAADATALGNLLIQEKSARPPERIATALDWTLPRLHAARDHLNTTLAPAGLQVVDTQITGWKLGPRDNTQAAASARLADLTDHQQSPNNGTLRVLYEAWTETLSNKKTRDIHATHLQALLKRGAVVKGQTRWNLSDATQHALDF